MTFLWQREVDVDDSWAKLPFARARALEPSDFVSRKIERRAEEVLEFEMSQGATVVVPPYLYAESPSDPAFATSIAFIAATSRAMRRLGIALPIMPVFAGAIKEFGAHKSYFHGVDRFVQLALEVGPERIGLMFSPTGAAADSHDKVLRLFAAYRRANYLAGGIPVIAMRQGVYGAGLLASGLTGYECGLGAAEQTQLVSNMSNRKPVSATKKNERRGGAAGGIYIDAFHRSVSSEVAETLFADRATRARLMCDDDRCCPNGASSTLAQRREHALRSRVREIASLEAQPHSLWRLHQVGRDAQFGVEAAHQANKVLEREGMKPRINPRPLEALARAADYFRVTEERREAA
jgi:hypothetical protein